MAERTRPVLTGLIGRNIHRSRAPRLHEAEAVAQGLRLAYRLFDTSTAAVGDNGIAGLLDAAERQSYAGLNITHPYKQAVLPLLTDLSDDAKLVGAVNTVVFDNGRRTGHNTDLYGFEKAFARELADVRKSACLQLGAGGAGAATSVAALRLGIERVYVFDIDTAKTSDLVARLGTVFGPGRASGVNDPVGAMRQVDGLINSTPVGMAEYPGTPVPLDSINPRHWVADIIYFPLQTELLYHAKAIGCRTMNGAKMAVYQAASAFELFTGAKADSERLLESFGST